MKVLVVDDVGYSRHYHTRLLQKFGFKSLAAESGAQALQVLEEDPTIGIVLTDLIMPEMDGVELFKQSSRLRRTAPAFVLMTAVRPGQEKSPLKDVEKIRLAKDIGFVDVLFKPIDPDLLKTTLEAIQGAPAGRVDTSSALLKVAEVITRLVQENEVDAAGHFLDAVRQELERLDAFVSQPV